MQLVRVLLPLVLFLAGIPAFSDDALRETPRFTLYFPDGRAMFSETQNLADHALSILHATDDELSELLDVQPSGKVVIRFLTPKEFHRRTGAPSWTSAMFLRGEISIPIADPRRVNFGELHRAVRHEYVHAVTAELSRRRCPAWLDEGIAQLFEGDPNPLLGPALRKWIASNDAMPLEWLQNGFTTLDNDLVPVAYAQSLFATRILVNELSYEAITKYLRELREGQSEEQAFETAFHRTIPEFERELTAAMRQWAVSPLRHP